MKRWIAILLASCWLFEAVSQQEPATKPEKPSAPAAKAKGKGGKKKRPQQDPAKRAKGIKDLCDRLEIRAGAAVADIGCGKGMDTMTLAGVVGPTGKAYGEDIIQGSLDALAEKAEKSGVKHVVGVLGNSEDPCLPDGALDLIFMQRVFHHFAKPKNMLAHFLRDLKPGGYLAIVDRERGPQRVWPEMASREKKHAWTGETTVVRLAREAGFQFENEFNDFWPDSKMFVAVFRRPEAVKGPGDPDLPEPIDAKAAAAQLPLSEKESLRLLFVGLDRGRSLLPALREKAGAGLKVQDVLLEEWRTYEEELPADVKSDSAEIVRTAQGDLPGLEKNSLDAVVFADGYSRLWDPAPLLRRLQEALASGGYVAILDRAGPDDERRSLANHRRRISPGKVKAEMKAAGFECVEELSPPAKDCFFLLFESVSR